MEREAHVREQGFKAAVQFAFAAARSTGAVPVEVLEDAVAFGEALIKPGVSLDDALEYEQALKALRTLVLYRKNLEGAPMTFEVGTAEDVNGTANVAVFGPELGELRPGQRVLVTITYDPTNYESEENGSADVTTDSEPDQPAVDGGTGQEDPE